MKSLAVAAVAIAFAGSAFAADLAVKAPPLAPAPVSSWTGWYIGANAGVDWGQNKVTYDPPGPPSGFHLAPNNDVVIYAAGASHDVSNRGFTGGGQVGYNYQFNQYIAGIEADIGYLERSGHFSGTSIGDWGTQNVNISGNSGWLATVRGRLGVVVNNKAFVYGTGGVAFTNADVNIGNNWNPAIGFRDASVNLTNTRTGWVAGAGVEYALQQNWSLKVEYLHLRFDDTATVSTLGMLSPGSTVFHSYSVDMSSNIVRVGLNYRLGSVYPR